MKLGILNDFEPGQRAGGANRAIEQYIACMPAEFSGNVAFCTPGHLDETCDAYLLFLTKRFDMQELGHVQNRPFIWCGFDWWPDEDGNSSWRNILTEKARLAFFVSPLHYNRFTRLYNAEPRNVCIAPPPLDLGLLRATQAPLQRNGRAAWAAEWHQAKGPDLAGVLARRLKIHMDMYSPSMPGNIVGTTTFTPFAHAMGFMPEDEWYDRLVQYSYLIHSPRVPDAFGYITLEAYALGLEVILTGASGVESYGRPFDELLEAANEAPQHFWQVVSSAL